MKDMRGGLGPIVVSLALVGAMGAVHGILIDRWGPSTELADAAAALERVPTDIGDWHGTDQPLTQRVIELAGIERGVFRRYHNAKTDQLVSILLVCGRGGPISVHTPDVCYEGAGFELQGAESPKPIDAGEGRTASFFVGRFARPGVLPSQLEIFWGWSTDGVTWQAPDNPRLSLARSRALYKLYVVREFTPGSPQESADTCEEFLKLALPVFQEVLAPKAE
jgi:hypothetical protein